MRNIRHRWEGSPEHHNFVDMSLNTIIINLAKNPESRANFRELTIVLSRVDACTPNTADVERLISADNRSKAIVCDDEESGGTNKNFDF